MLTLLVGKSFECGKCRALAFAAVTAFACQVRARAADGGLQKKDSPSESPQLFWGGRSEGSESFCFKAPAFTAREERRLWMKEALRSAMKELRLSGLAETLDVRLQEASANHLNHMEFLELILQDELSVRKERLIARRTKAAMFHDVKTIEDFDWDFNPAIRKKQMFELATCKFIRRAEDILFVGPPGVGKSHLVQAIGYQAVKMGFTVLYRSIFDLVREFLQDEAFSGEEKILVKYLKPELLIIDDMGMKQLPKRSGEFLFEVIMRRHENRSTIMTVMLS